MKSKSITHPLAEQVREACKAAIKSVAKTWPGTLDPRAREGLNDVIRECVKVVDDLDLSRFNAVPPTPCEPRRSSPGLAARPDSTNGVSPLPVAAIPDEKDPLAKSVGTAPAPAAMPEEPCRFDSDGYAINDSELIRGKPAARFVLAEHYDELRAYALAQRDALAAAEQRVGELEREKESLAEQARISIGTACARAAQLKEKLDAANAALRDFSEFRVHSTFDAKGTYTQSLSESLRTLHEKHAAPLSAAKGEV